MKTTPDVDVSPVSPSLSRSVTAEHPVRVVGEVDSDGRGGWFSFVSCQFKRCRFPVFRRTLSLFLSFFIFVCVCVFFFVFSLKMFEYFWYIFGFQILVKHSLVFVASFAGAFGLGGGQVVHAGQLRWANVDTEVPMKALETFPFEINAKE